MTRYTFKAEDLSHGSTTTSEVDYVSWPDVAEAFYLFLLGSGFTLTRQDLSDMFDEHWNIVPEDCTCA